MVFPTRSLQGEEEIDGEPLLVPLAVPLIAGPSLLAVLLLFSTAEPGRLVDLLLAAGLAWSATFVVLFASTFLFRFLTKRGLVAVERLMGMVLVALAVQLFLDGVSKYLR
jgi:multiple antibiotic resistance protein